jgi:hypothetical protein
MTRGGGNSNNPEAQSRWDKAVGPSEQARKRAQKLLELGDIVGAEQEANDAIRLASGISPLTQELARRLIAHIRMEQGQYQDALKLLGADWIPGGSSRVGLDIALCYVRLGNLPMARKFYSDEEILRYSFIKREDLPGICTSPTLEASILMARGLLSYFSYINADAARDLHAANRLAPRNGMIPYFNGKALIKANRASELAQCFARAATFGNAMVSNDAMRRLSYLPKEVLGKALADAANLRSPDLIAPAAKPAAMSPQGP